MQYEEKLRQEARYWGENAHILFQSGAIPYDFDRRKATHITDPNIFRILSARRSDPVAEEIWAGENIAYILELSKSCKDAIDLGCGGGWMTLELARSGIAVIGYDIGEGRLQMAREYYEKIRLEEPGVGTIIYKQADLNKLELPPELIDLAVSIGTFHHILENRRLTHQVYNALRSGGYFIIMDVAEERVRFANRVGNFLLLLFLLPVPSYIPFASRILHVFFSFVSIFLGHDRTHHIKIVLKRVLLRNKKIAGGAPFEGAGMYTEEIVRSVFKKVDVSYRSSFGIRNRLNFKLKNRYAFLKLLNKIDNYFAGSKVCPGTVLFLVARKD